MIMCNGIPPGRMDCINAAWGLYTQMIHFHPLRYGLIKHQLIYSCSARRDWRLSH